VYAPGRDGAGTGAFVLLGAVVLAVTGAERCTRTGAFGKSRAGWRGLVCVSVLLMDYFGQGAVNSAQPGGMGNPFISSPARDALPAHRHRHGRGIIASQALISALSRLTQPVRELATARA